MKSLTLLRALVLTTGLSIAGAAPAQNVSIEDLRKQLDAPWKAKDWPASETIARQIAAQPGSTALDWRNLVNVLRNQKKIDDAFLARQELVKRAGANSSDHNGICWHLLERYKALEARLSCQKAVDLDNTNLAALVNLGHTDLLSGDKTQSMAWYRKTLPQINKEEELKDGPLDDWNLFIKNGWAVADAQAAKLWFEQSWVQLVVLRNSRNTARDLAKRGKPLEAMQQLLANRDQATQLVGDGGFASSFLLAYSRIASETLDDLIDKKHQHAQAIAFVDTALQQAGNRLPDERRWDMLRDLKSNLSADNQTIPAHTVQERIYAEQLSKLGTDHIDTFATAHELAVYHYNTNQYDKAVAMGEKVLAARTTKLGADHPQTLTSMGNLALTHYKLRMYARAVPILQASIPKEFGWEGESKDVQSNMALLVLCLDGVGKKPDFLLAYKPETQAEVMRLAPALKTSLLKTTLK